MWRIKTTAIRRGRIFQSRQVPTTFHWGNHEMVDLTEQEIEAFDDPAFLNFQTYRLSEKHSCWESMAGMTTNILI